MRSNEIHKTINQVLYVVQRRKWHILLCVVGVLAPIMWYNKTALPTYEARVSIIYEDKSSPLTNNRYDALRRYSRETMILNRIEEINSRSLAEEIAAGLPSDLVSRLNFPEQRAAEFDTVKFVGKQIQESISASPKGKTDVIEIVAQTNDPFLSMDLANTAAKVLYERNLRNKRNEVRGLREFIERQLTVFRDELHSAEKKLKDFKQRRGITFLDHESKEILRRITEAEVINNQVKARKKSTEERLLAIREKLSSQRQELVPTITDVSNSWLQNLQDRLVELHVQYTRLQVQNYQSGHPKMVRLQGEIEQTKKSLIAEALKLAQNDSPADPLSQIRTYVAQSLSVEIELTSLRGQEQALEKVIERYEGTLRTLPAKEFELANLMRSKVVNEKIYMTLMEKHEEARISEEEKVANLRIIDTAELPTLPLKPRKKLNLAIGLIMGLVSGLGWALFFEYVNTSLKTSEEIEELTSWPVLATIPNFGVRGNGEIDHSSLNHNSLLKPQHRKRFFHRREGVNVTPEAYHVLCSNLQVLRDKVRLDTILITSLAAQEGKSTTTINLGISFAKLGLRVLMIDADLRRPTMHGILGIGKVPGLSDILTKLKTINNDFAIANRKLQFESKVSESSRFSDVRTHYRKALTAFLMERIQSTKITNLEALTCGKVLTNPRELLTTFSMKALLSELKNRYDVILIDSPPLLLVSESIVLSTMVDGVMLVIKSNKNERELLTRAKQILDNSKAITCGVVLNGVDPKLLYRDKGYYNYYG